MRRTIFGLTVVAGLGLLLRLGQYEPGQVGSMELAFFAVLALILRGGQVLAFLVAACSPERFAQFRRGAVFAGILATVALGVGLVIDALTGSGSNAAVCARQTDSALQIFLILGCLSLEEFSSSTTA
jgi:hypothetical protein